MGRRSRVGESRSYGQREPVAAALDVVGDRWSLLIVRELMLGPQRWSDLLANLDGIGKNLLARRLRDLTALDVVARTQLPWSSDVRVYSLGPRGKELESAIFALARFGLGAMPAHGTTNAAWAALALAASRDPNAVDVTLVVIDGSDFSIRTGEGVVSVRRGHEGETAVPTVMTTAEALRAAAR